MVVDHLDPVSDRNALVILLRVSSTMYDISLPVLYAKVVLDGRA